MSFSADIKKELVKQSSGNRQAMAAELAALLVFAGAWDLCGGERQLTLRTDYPDTAERFRYLARRLTGQEISMQIRTYASGRKKQYVPEMTDREGKDILSELLRISRPFLPAAEEEVIWLQQKILRRESCRRAFLRGAFLASGSMSDPNRSYHFEIVCPGGQAAGQLLEVLLTLEIEGKQISRRGNAVIYVKESGQIGRLLGLMDARMSLLSYENIRILREVRGNINRQVNCETANISKTASAAAQQIADIEYIRKTTGFSELTNRLDEMAAVRLQYPTASLQELGSYLDPPLGKSGVNHRLRKLSEIAGHLREQQGGVCDD